MSTRTVPLDEPALLDAARRAQAAAASLQSPAHDIQSTLRDLHTALLSTDARALRRSVGFFGRLLGNDIDLQARSEDLRARLALLVQQARQRGEALDGHNHALVALRDEMTGITEGLAASIAGTDPDEPANHERLRMLDAVRTGCALTAAQLDLLVQNGHALAARYRHMLPTVEGLLVQHRAALAGQQDASMLRDAAALVASVEAAIPASAIPPSEIQSHVVAKESP